MENIKEIVEELFGEGSIFCMDDSKPKPFNPDDFVSTGSRTLNYYLTGNSKCGFRKGRVYEIYGPEGTGKTTLALHACAEANSLGIQVVYLDVEHALDLKYAKAIGINPKLFLISQPECGEDAFSISDEILKKITKPVLFVYDSVANMVPRAEIEGDMDDKQMGEHARLMGKGLRKLTGLFAKTKSPVIFLNQIRNKIGGYGNPEVPTGGNALKFYATGRIEIRSPRKGKITEGPKNSRGKIGEELDEDDSEREGKVEVGKEVNLKIIKNKLYPPFKECSLNLIYGRGIDKKDDLLRFFNALGLVDFKGKKLVYHHKTMLRQKFLKRLEEKDFKKRLQREVAECQKN